MGRLSIIVALAALLAGAAAVAHGPGDPAMGTVVSVAPDRLVLDAHGHELDFALTPATRFLRGMTPIRRDEVRPGERAAVVSSADPREALRVRLAPAGPR